MAHKIPVPANSSVLNRLSDLILLEGTVPLEAFSDYCQLCDTIQLKKNDISIKVRPQLSHSAFHGFVRFPKVSDKFQFLKLSAAQTQCNILCSPWHLLRYKQYKSLNTTKKSSIHIHKKHIREIGHVQDNRYSITHTFVMYCVYHKHVSQV